MKAVPQKPTAADLFCGAGNASAALRDAMQLLGRDMQLTAINHWDVAIATHEANFPGQIHRCTGIDNVNPCDLYQRGQLFILIGGPECIEYSQAAGKKPTNYQYRPTPWCMSKWADHLRPWMILIENVPEFRKKWPPYQAWLESFRQMGYEVDDRVHCAANHGDPTTRERLFIQCMLPPFKVVWPEATHAEDGGNDLFGLTSPWKSARDHVVDWSIKGRWLDEMPGKKKYGGLPLSPKTIGRIWDGLMNEGLQPIIATFDNQSAKRGHRRADEPLSTVTSKARHGLAVPQFLVKLRGTGKTSSLEKPAPTVTAGGGHLALAEGSFLVHSAHGESGPNSKRRGKGFRSLDKPVGTIAGSNDLSLVEPFIVPGYGERKGQKPRTHSLSKPAPTVCASSHHHLVEPVLIHTAHGGKRRSRKISEPMPAVAGNRGDVALCEFVLPQGGGGVARKCTKPVPTVHTAGAIALIEAFIVQYYGTGKSKSLRYPLPTVTAKDRFALVCPEVVIRGRRGRIRCRWRMLQPHELARAQSFWADYKFYGAKKVRGGKRIIELNGNKGDVVKQIGNAWPRKTGVSIFLAMLSQRSDVRQWMQQLEEQERAAA